MNTEDAESVVHDKLEDAQTPGLQVECDPDEAIRLGAFVEDAISENDAIISSIDLVDVFNANL